MFIQTQRLGARMLLAAIGGLAGLVAGAGGHYHADYQTKKKNGNRSKIGRGQYGRTLISHFDSVGICWSAKQNYIDKARNRAKSRSA